MKWAIPVPSLYFCLTEELRKFTDQVYPKMFLTADIQMHCFSSPIVLFEV